MDNSQNTPNTPAPRDEVAVPSFTTTVFSDGSTFDYENGYQSNGAPAATRDRTEIPKIVKSHSIFTAGRVIGLLGSLLIASLLLAAAAAIITGAQRIENWEVLKDGVNDSGQVEVVQSTDPSNLIVKRPDGTMFNCDVSMISNGGDPVGLVFCAEGNSATFTIPLRRDPSNILYMAPLEEIEKFQK
jgi:hypothetical protein